MEPGSEASPRSPIGQAVSRVDGRAKVTGTAAYAAEAMPRHVTYGVLVQSTIAKGAIRAMHLDAAEAAEGVLCILTPLNMSSLAPAKDAFYGEQRMPLSDMAIHYAGQHIALVVADSLERARWAASLVRVDYSEEVPKIGLSDPSAPLELPGQFLGQRLQVHKGDAAIAERSAAVRLRETYRTPVYTHNPMEPSATVASWEGDQLTVWESTQDVTGTRNSLAGLFGLDLTKVHVICPYTGGGFGCKGTQWPHTALAVEAARRVRRPVKLVLTRHQMFTSCGNRPSTEQTISLAAQNDGKLVSIVHASMTYASTVGDYIETSGELTTVLYATPHLEVTHRVRKLNVGTPTFMRAPGEMPGSFALESAMDEVANRLSIDPLEFRLRSYAEEHPLTGMPWSSKHLRKCYEAGARESGWFRRNPVPGSMRDRSGRRIGWGMATATYPALSFSGTARIRLTWDAEHGLRASGAAAAQDLGTGTWTVGRQITAAEVGLPLDKVDFELGNSDLPPSSGSSGSSLTASLTRALSEASLGLRAELLRIAQAQSGSVLAGLTPVQVRLDGNRLHAMQDPQRGVGVDRLIQRSGLPYIEGSGLQGSPGELVNIKNAAIAGQEDYAANASRFAFHSFGAHFIQVMIDDPVPLVRVLRVVSVMDVGRVINPETARSQVVGGVVMGVGAALMEETRFDPKTARITTANLADYSVCTQPDVHHIEAHFTDEPDRHFNSLGCRGVGEIGITGVAAAVANAVFHASGKRIRELPITPDKLL